MIQFDKISKNINSEIELSVLAFGKHLSGAIAKALRDKGGVSSSELVGSFSPALEKLESGSKVTVGSPLWDAYGSHVEFGTKPHWLGRDGITSLITWVREKKLHVIAHYVKTGKVKRFTLNKGGGTKQEKFEDRAVKSIAYAVRAAIAKRGTKPKRYVEEAISSFGLPFSVIHDATGSFYAIDIVPYLEREEFWNKVEGVN